MNHRHLFVKHWLVILQIFCIAGLLSAGNDPANKTIPTLRQPEIGADGAFRFQIVGPAGERVVIETSEDLKTWHRLEEMSLTERPSIITDSNAPTTRARFYRLGWQSNVTARAWDDSEAQSVRAAGASYNDNWRESSVSYSRESLTSTASSNANETLFTRRYKVRRDLFLAALETFARTGTPPTFGHETSVRVVKEQIMTKEVASFQELVMDLFRQTGVDLHPPKAIFFNDREGSLLVHAAQSDLNLIESTLQVLNTPASALRVKVQVFELSGGSTSFGWIEQQNSLANEAKLVRETNVVTCSGRIEHIEIAAMPGKPQDAPGPNAGFPKPGLSLDFIVHLNGDGGIQITATSSFVQGLGAAEPGLFVPAPVYDYSAPRGQAAVSLDRRVASALPVQARESIPPVTVRSAATMPLRFLSRRITTTTTVSKSAGSVRSAALGVRGSDFAEELTNDYLISLQVQSDLW